MQERSENTKKKFSDNRSNLLGIAVFARFLLSHYLSDGSCRASALKLCVIRDAVFWKRPKSQPLTMRSHQRFHHTFPEEKRYRLLVK